MKYKDNAPELQSKIDHLKAEIIGRDNMVELLLERSAEYQKEIESRRGVENSLRAKLVALQAEYDKSQE